nr:helix-turn-helix domain-containing protein [Maricaulis parjimensis]
MRSRAGLTQRGLAELLGTTQPHISRIEAGQIDPPHELAAKITYFRDAPQSRGVLASIEASVRQDPHIACLIRPDDAEIRYETLSAGMRNHPLFKPDGEGDRIRPEVSPQGVVLIEKIKESGIFDGRVDAIETLWDTHVGDDVYYWHSTHTPIQTDRGERFVYCALRPIEQRDYESLHAEWGDVYRVLEMR